MNAFEFNKSLLERLEESACVLQSKGGPVPASDVRSEWTYHVELQIEPAGWQGLWKISRATCESLGIKYPTIVYGTVDNVLFKELKAEFTVTRVQDDDIHIFEKHEVPLEDLWPTIEQENAELNVERTADCIDQLRFFYRNVWMPWDNDNDDDLDWAEKHLESRIKFCFDLKRGMNRATADHIRVQLMEARYIQSRREIIEVDMSDDEELDDAPSRSKVTDLMRLHLRLAVIRNEIELLENPAMRKIYEEINFAPKITENDRNPSSVLIVTKTDTIDHQMEYLAAIRKRIAENKVVKISPTLKECLHGCATKDEIYIPSGRHCIKFMEPLSAIGAIRAVVLNQAAVDEMSHNKVLELVNSSQADEKCAIIASEENDNTLMVFNGDYTLENLWLDCRNVRLGIWVRRGTLTMKNCRLIGDAKSSTNNGIAIGENAACVLENTTIYNFANGIVCGDGSKVKLRNVSLLGCRIGLYCNEESVVECEKTKIQKSSQYGIFYEASDLNAEFDAQKICLNDCVAFKAIVQANDKSASFNGDVILEDNKKANIVILNRNKPAELQNSAFIEEMSSDGDGDGDRTVDGNVSYAGNELSFFSLSHNNDTIDHHCDDDNMNVSAKSNGAEENSFIVIEDDD